MAKRKLSAYNRHMQREMRKGRTFKQAVASWRGGRKTTRKTSKSVKPKRRRTRSMAKKRRPRRRGFLNMQTIGGLIEKVALAAPAISVALEPIQPVDKLRKGVMYYTGFNWADKSFDITRAAVGWGPFVLVKFIRKGISFVNKILSGL